MTGPLHRARVLFVDDEPSILDGLRDLLRRQRKRWDMEFALGGAAALEALGRGQFDVVVSDMRMPGMDGATLLAKVKDQNPACARIILSGHADREAVVKALPVAHQFLNKPCDGEVLRLVIERACELQRLLHDESIRSVISNVETLPSVPQIYWDLTRAAVRPEVTVFELAQIIEQDPAMSVKVLQLVNSSYFGNAQRLTSVQKAVASLGTDLLKALALVVRVFDKASGELVPGLALEELQRHSLLTARLGQQIVTNPKLAAECFTAGVIHDVGKIVLSMGITKRYAEVVEAVQRTGRPYCAVERELLGFTHAEVGGYLLGRWGLPLTIVEAVTLHHAPSLVGDGDVTVLAALHIAEALVSQATSRTPDVSSGELDMAFVERVGLRAELPRFTSIAQEMAAETRST